LYSWFHTDGPKSAKKQGQADIAKWITVLQYNPIFFRIAQG
jgi:hypothetical protein